MSLSKRSRWGAAVAVAGVAAVAATVTVTVWAQGNSGSPDYDAGDCKASPLKVDGGTWGGTVTAVSASGEYILGEGDSVLWGPDNETVKMTKTVKDGLKGAATVEALDVNSQGEVIGQSYTKSRSTLLPWKYADGTVTKLNVPKKYAENGGATVYDVNENGDAVGTPNSGDYSGVILKWSAGETDAEVVADEDVELQFPALTDDGTVIATGNFGSDPGGDRLWQWDEDGNREKLPFPEGVGNETPQIAGDWVLAESQDTFYRWNMAEDGKPQKSKLDTTSSIDDRGRVFGKTDEVPAVQTDSKVEKLPVLDGADAKEFNVAAVGSESGVLAGIGKTKDGDTAMRWDCD